MSKASKPRASKSKATDAQDVLQFLDSLPEVGHGKRETLKPKSVKAGKTGGTADAGSDSTEAKKSSERQGEEIFEFLDELERSKLSMDKEKKKDKKKEPETVTDLPKKEANDLEKKEKETVAEAVETQTSDEEQLKDPITTLSNWWSTSGSSKVSTFWEKATEQASQLRQKVVQQETTAQLPISLDAIKSSLPVNINIDNINSNLKDLATNLNATATIHDITKQLTKFVVGETEEVLRIHLVHDLVNLDYLQRHVQDSFERVLGNQVQGNVRVFVDEWSKPNSEGPAGGGSGSGALGQLNIFSSGRCQLNVFEGKISDGEKLAFANLDNAVKLFTKSREEIAEQQRKMAASTDDKDDTNSDSDSDNEPRSNISDVFMSILPVAVVKNNSTTGDESETIVTTDSTSAGNFSFTIVLRDVTNDITTITRSQGFPLKWVEWVEKKEIKSKDKDSAETDTTSVDDDDNEMEEIDVGEWVQDWLEDGISLAIGIVAQNYVINRMGL